jgi:signal recognition particle subunit SRP19
MRDKIVIWPAYIDSHKSRSEGRKISEKEAIPSPTLEEIKAAADKIGLNPIVEKDKAFPREWWEVSGRVLVDKRKPKSLLLKDIAREIRRSRG